MTEETAGTIVAALKAPSFQQDSAWHSATATYATKPRALLDEAADRITALEAERDNLRRLLAEGWKAGDRRASPVLLEREGGANFVQLVWAVNPQTVRLIAVCSDEAKADRYAANLPPGLTGFKPWKERAPIDHSFGFADSLHGRILGKLK